MTVQDELGGPVGVALVEAEYLIGLRLCGYLMLQRVIGQNRKRHMGIDVNQIHT